MAPTTRRSTKEAIKTDEKELVSSRGKRKSTGNDDENDDNDDAASPIPEITPPKRQRLAVRTREDDSTRNGRKLHIEVEIPTLSSSKAKRSKTNIVPDSQEKGQSASGSDPEAEPSSASKQLEEEASQRVASQSLEPDATPAPKSKGKHLVFGDDDDVENFVAAASTAKVDKVEDEQEASDDDDDDDAPEAMSTQTAAKNIQKAAQAASKTAERQAASLKRKRQEKDTLYKQQAEKRKRARSTVQVHQSKQSTTNDNNQVSSSDEEGHGTAEVETAITAGRRRTQKFHLPAVLPAEFLTDSSSEDEDDGSALKRRKTAPGKQPKKIDFDSLGSEGKRPRDQVVGSTRYRVLADQGDPGLAPRTHRDARKAKENLLKRKRAGVVVNKRKGFFVK